MADRRICFVHVVALAVAGCFAIGAWLRRFQTGFIRSYILFLALAAMAVWMLLYAWASALGGG